MDEEFSRDQAMVLFEQAYRKQVKGELGDAIVLYKRSLSVFPTAEAHTFLGWTYSILDRYDEAIACCKAAIEVDPPYNDIGAYLIEQEEWEEAIPWLEEATKASRYEAPQYPHLNLGRIYEHLGRFKTAVGCYDKALDLDPYYRAAIWAKFQLLGRMN